MANEYLTFAAPSLDTFTAAQWATYTGLLANGFATGLADTTEVNTLMRQLSVPVSALGQYISDAGYSALDNGSRSDFQTAFANALKKNLLASDQATWIQDKGGNNRLFMATGGTTTWKGYGTTPVTLQNAAGTTIFTANDDGRITGGANAVSGLDLITYQQWAAGNNQYTTIISVPGSRSSTYYMTTAEYGSLVILQDGFTYNLVLPPATGNPGKTITVYNSTRNRAPDVMTTGSEMMYGSAFDVDASYAGEPDKYDQLALLPRLDYRFISDGANWICSVGGRNVTGSRSVYTRANFLAGTTSFKAIRRELMYMRITLVGGGGGGGDGGGGSGAVQIINVYRPPVVDSFTINTIGAGGASGADNGANGGATTITFPASEGSYVCTAGGGFGAVGLVGGAGGVSTATIGGIQQHLSGNPGGCGLTTTQFGALGGATPMFGGGGAAGIGAGILNRNGSWGGGGGGLYAGDGTSGNGGDGFIVVEEF